jgi:hypothetical protein
VYERLRGEDEDEDLWDFYEDSRDEGVELQKSSRKQQRRLIENIKISRSGSMLRIT